MWVRSLAFLASFAKSAAAARGIIPVGHGAFGQSATCDRWRQTGVLYSRPARCARRWTEEEAGQRTHPTRVILLARPRGAHRVRLSGPGLTVCEQGDIVALDKGVDAVAEVVPHALLLDILAEDAVEDEELAALGRVDGQAGRRGDVGDGPLEALRDEVEAGVGRAQRRTDPDGCSRKGQHVKLGSTGAAQRIASSTCVSTCVTCVSPSTCREPDGPDDQTSTMDYAPTLTEVLTSSSDSRLPPPPLPPLPPPPCLLHELVRLSLLFGRIMALTGLGGPWVGDSGGEAAMATVDCGCCCVGRGASSCRQTMGMF